MTFTIATANSRKDKVWKNKETTWADFLERVKVVVRTSESVAEYRGLPKSKQDEIKDVGGFVAGKLKDGKRKTGFVEYRSMLTLDMDYADKGVWEQITMFYDFTCCIYSTHKHTPEKPRLRLVIPLSRNVSADEYAAISRMAAYDIGIEQFDDCTYEPERLMYWASTPSDGEFIFESQNGKFLDPDTVLLRYNNWRDTREWKVSSRQQEIVKRNITKQADPLEKGGVIGVFCRTYSIETAIEKFLPDVYTPSLIEGRYDYIPADSTAGVLIYDGKFAYSHHATDPACSKLCNAFDLVRIHKCSSFEDEKSAMKAMVKLALSDSEIKKALLEEKLENAKNDFNRAEADEAYNEKWHTKLELDDKGEIKDNLKNLIYIMENDPELKGIIFNSLSDSIEKKGNVPWKNTSQYWRDADDAQLVSYVDRTYCEFSMRNYNIAVAKVADDRSYHPIKQYLESLPAWDGVSRVDTLLIDYLGADDNEYVRAVTRKTLCAAVARVYTPGIKFDTTLILNGPQGTGKSTIIFKLGGEWFSDSLQLSDTHDKTAAEKLQGYWILEIGELAGLSKADVEVLKSFTSRQDDKYRASFGKRVTPHPRQCIFIGTTNAESGFLKDITGNRRFWVVRTKKGKKAVWDMTEDDISQIWAEVIVKYKQKESLILPESLEKMAETEQLDAMEHDAREGMVREYLDRLLPENWSKMDLYARRSFLRKDDINEVEGTVPRERVCTMEIWCECFGKEAADFKAPEPARLNAIMKSMTDWEKYEGNKLGNIKFPIYGPQRAFIKVNRPGKQEGNDAVNKG